MRYDLSLTVEYDYAQASDHARNLLHLVPRHVPGLQTLLASSVDIDPSPQERIEHRDFFGNAATWIAFHDPIESIRLTLKAKVERHGAAQSLDLSCALADLPREIAAQARLDADAPHHFLGASPRVAPRRVLSEYARAQTPSGASVWQTVRALGRALHEDMAFDPKATDADTPPEQAFAQRRGVCQDFSHVMIACLRGLGVPAGYVSGFLRTEPPPGHPRLEGADAMHAWVRAWCGTDLGWVEYDPTNDIMAERDHIVVAYGRDYADVSPVRGTLRSTGGQTSRHFVDMVPMDRPARRDTRAEGD